MNESEIRDYLIEYNKKEKYDVCHLTEEGCISYEASLGDNVERLAGEMSNIANNTNRPVIMKANGALFAVNPGMTPEEAFGQWKIVERKEQADINKAKMEAKFKDIRNKKEKEADDLRITGLTFEIQVSKDVFDKIVKENYYSGDTVSLADRWARLMKAEMEDQGTKELTDKIALDTLNRANIFPEGDIGNAIDLLTATWERGDKLGKIFDKSPEQIKKLRKDIPNGTANQKGIPNGTIKSRVIKNLRGRL